MRKVPHRKIKIIDTCLQYIEEEKGATKDALRKKRASLKGNLAQKRKDMISKYAKQMETFYFWSQHIFKDKHSDQRLIVRYTQNFEKATNESIIQKFNNQPHHPQPTYEWEQDEVKDIDAPRHIDEVKENNPSFSDH